VDVYNDMNRGKQPEIQMVLDFTEDVTERQQVGQSRKRSKSSDRSNARDAASLSSHLTR
jgi:hypothetical protein